MEKQRTLHLKRTDFFRTLTVELPARLRCDRSADCHSETRSHLGLSTGASLAQPYLRLWQSIEQPPPSGLTNQETQNTVAEHEFSCRPALNLCYDPSQSRVGAPCPPLLSFSSSFWRQRSLTAQGLASPLTALTTCQGPKGRGLLAQCTKMKSTFSMNRRRPRQRQPPPPNVLQPLFPKRTMPSSLKSTEMELVQEPQWSAQWLHGCNGPRVKASSLPASHALPRPAPVVTALAKTFLSTVGLALAQPRPSNRVMPCFCPL